MSQSRTSHDLSVRADAIRPAKPTSAEEVYACVYLHDHDAGDLADVFGLETMYPRVVAALVQARTGQL